MKGLLIILISKSCKKDDDSVKIRDVADQALADDTHLKNFLETHFYNYEDFEMGENFYEGRNVNHEKTYENLRYEQYKWDNRSLLYFIDDSGNLCIKVNEEHTYPTGV